MSRAGHITIQTHGAFELGLGTALIVLPYAIGLSPGAVIAGIALGALLCGLAITGSEPGDRASVPLTAHATYDWVLCLALLAAGIVFGVAQGVAPLAFFLSAGAVELALVAPTSYSAQRA